MSSPCQVLYIAHTSEAIYWRTAYALLSCLAQHPGERSFTLVLYTDAPEFFSPFSAWVDIRVLEQSSIRQWISDAKGYRNIVKAVVFEQLKESFLFFDSDTVLLKPVDGLIARLSPQTSIMQEQEYRLGKRKEFLPLIQDSSFPEFTKDTWMYNSGILGVHRDNLDLIRQVRTRVLHLLRHHSIRTPEQLTDSIVLLSRTRILEAPSWVYHYWQDKGFPERLIAEQVKSRGLAEAIRIALSPDSRRLFPLGFRRYPALYSLYMRVSAKLEVMAEGFGKGRT